MRCIFLNVNSNRLFLFPLDTGFRYRFRASACPSLAALYPAIGVPQAGDILIIPPGRPLLRLVKPSRQRAARPSQQAFPFLKRFRGVIFRGEPLPQHFQQNQCSVRVETAIIVQHYVYSHVAYAPVGKRAPARGALSPDMTMYHLLRAICVLYLQGKLASKHARTLCLFPSPKKCGYPVTDLPCSQSPHNANKFRLNCLLQDCKRSKLSDKKYEQYTQPIEA